MLPSSRGLFFLSIVRRHASTVTSPKSAPKLPPRSPVSSSQNARIPKSERKSDSSSDPKSFEHAPFERRRLLRTFLFSPHYRHWRRWIALCPILVLAYMHFPYEVLNVNGPSMSPLLNPNHNSDTPETRDYVLVRRWQVVPRIRGADRQGDQRVGQTPRTEDVGASEFQRGQIVTFRTPHRPDTIAVKRIVGLPGDAVRPLPGYSGQDTGNEEEDIVVVPWNHLWVEGDADSRMLSMDSNWYGPISQNLVIGEVIAVLGGGWEKTRWSWIDWKTHRWSAREKGRIEEDAIAEAMVDPDVVIRNNGWTDGSIARVLGRMKSKPDQMLYSFVNDTSLRQESRRLYNNALYVAEVAQSEKEKQLAREVVWEMEELYGREALIFGIRMKRQRRQRGSTPDAVNSKIGEKASQDPTATDAENWLRKQGWELQKNLDGSVKTKTSD